jgi:hypothetical protein
MTDAPSGGARQPASKKLNDLNKDDENDNNSGYDPRGEVLIPESHAQVTQSASADRAQNCSISEQTHKTYRKPENDCLASLRKKHFQNDLQRRCSHRQRRLDQSLIDIPDRAIDGLRYG